MRFLYQIRSLRIMYVFSDTQGNADMVGHNKVEDIHPSHAFLSLPDVVLPPIGSSLDAHLSNGRPAPPRRKPVLYITRKETKLMYSCSYASPWCFLSQVSFNHLLPRLYADMSAASRTSSVLDSTAPSVPHGTYLSYVSIKSDKQGSL
jgi:hypothetical protein